MASLSLKSAILAAWSWSREGQTHNDHVSITLTSLFVVITLLMWFAWMMKKTAVKYPLPPGPRGLPLVGNLPFIDRDDVYRYFSKMTDMYGPIFKLKMGSKLYVVVGSTSYAKEVLKDSDIIFANRDTPSAIVKLSYGGSGIIWTSRQLRRTVQFLYSKIGSPIDIADQMFFTNLNTIMSMLWGGTVKDDEMSNAGKEFQQATIEAIALMGEANISDLFPLLARFDIQGIARRAQTLLLWFDRILDSIINERIKFNQAGEKNENRDFLDILLELKDRGDTKIPITIVNIKALFLDLVVAATDTTAAAVEWAMAEIMNHPEVMKRIQEELVTVVGENCVGEDRVLGLP
ncbi:Cytochrome p450 [Thalictrum thalictroides]|uniref:Cytochrome p450 n=1 Tax=Thalictrum thalictroides TaxID=46969 RepID=A0A7J6X898_THATH|nr:Cytochrome p450 [Thalictrum thalictroides]